MLRCMYAFHISSLLRLLLHIKVSRLLLLFCSRRHSDTASLSLSLSIVCCQLSRPTTPSPVSSRNRSGSGSCRSMEISVHTVYVIVASINALLICSGLQPSIHVIHPRTRPSPNCCCFTHNNTHTHFRGKQHRRKQQHEQRLEQEGQQTRTCFSFLVCVRSQYLTIRVLIGYRYTSAHLHNCQLKQQTEISQTDKKNENFKMSLVHSDV